ncbi:MAG TPA: RpiB/LacA/LacB family sugar-phosphate isomerase [Candidatus Babeliales bacterium]|nr:RpiB/LacA/LacB family sugar-phosphate isomerase [Candidatus Babeliales bacterium]
MILRIAMGADHRGYELKKFIIENLVANLNINNSTPTNNELVEIHYSEKIIPEKTMGQKISWLDQGCHNNSTCDYPEFAHKVCQQILTNQADLGILICGSGIGMSIAANRYSQIYAGLAWNAELAQTAKAVNNCNILVLPANFLTPELTLEIIRTWLSTKFKAGKYQTRLNNLDLI